MQYILGIIGILIIIALIFWAGIGILALIGLAFKYLSILIAAFIGVSLLYGFITKKHDKQKVKSYLATIIVCIGLYAISFPILNLTSSVWDWAQEDNKKENNDEDTMVNETNKIDEINKEDESILGKEIVQNQVKKQEDKVKDIEEKNEVWIKNNIVRKLQDSNVLKDSAKFTDMGFGTKIKEHDKSDYGKTNLKNAYVLELSICKLNDSKITNTEQMKEIVFNIVKEIHTNVKDIDYNLCVIGIHFTNTDSSYGFGGTNFYLGVNTINNYFSEPRTDKVGISTVDGSITELKFDSSSFYQWIEYNFTQPEDSSVLAEDTSWTTTSSKGAIFP